MRKLGCFLLTIFLLLLVFNGIGSATEFLTFGTGSPGGVYYLLGGAMADFWTRLLDVDVTAESTAASVENCRLTGSNEVQLGMAMSDVAFKAYHGQVQFENDKQPILALFSMYPALQHFISIDPEIKSVSDLKGKKVSVDAPGSGCETMARLIIEAAGLSYDDMQVSYYSQPEAAQAMKDMNIDALFYNFAYPGASVQEITAVRDVYFVPIDDDIIEKLSAEYGYYMRGAFPPGVYKGQDMEVPSIQVGNDVVVNANIDDEIAYQLTKALFENAEDLHDVHPAAHQFVAENGVKTSIPLHPGAARYFEEIGLGEFVRK
ncbi:MAG: TAXI family TRAP transporter solute-binding subunit [Atribacterota bacterium]|jgi:TRAP transporter TAXI family solute receptor|nr:TAXI family TRAP transporter solute-binding subunit [Atribacterota bacterium]MDD4895921.1 TAXI family TRAP transporter solute-binding subunit [Atribacterota bacterium]MDD5637532.1 TAXI family TRAP transporter solute-binding subunit [Atribacterota bacterium]